MAQFYFRQCVCALAYAKEIMKSCINIVGYCLQTDYVLLNFVLKKKAIRQSIMLNYSIYHSNNLNRM